MKISATNNYNQNKSISHKGGHQILRTLANPDALASTILLESCVTGGRSYNAYKRGGKDELRERAIDDVLSAIFWLKGVDIFNNIGNKVGKHVLKVPETEFDVGKDALRTPFNNLIADLPKKGIPTEKLAGVEKKLAVFKFSKIILSTLCATAFVGFILPKINQALTRALKKKDTENTNVTEKQEKQKPNPAMLVPMLSVTMEEFSKKLQNNTTPSFKGLQPDTLTTIAHYLENNKVCKLLSSDVGILSGRVVTARNPDEGLEYLFRDSASSFFYIASTPLIYSLLQKATNSVKYTTIDPVAAKQVHEHCMEQLKNIDSIDAKEFSQKVLGSLNKATSDFIDKLPFISDVISLDKLKEHVTDENIIKKAAEMAKLQPEQAGIGKVLTRQQVKDVFKTGSINTPEFMMSVFKEGFGEDLTNPLKYIPMKKITKFRDNIDDYVESAVKMANKTNNGQITKELLQKLNKKSFGMSATFRAIALGISAFALGIAIPKIQYAITKHRTGSDEAPGLREFNKITEEAKA